MNPWRCGRYWSPNSFAARGQSLNTHIHTSIYYTLIIWQRRGLKASWKSSNDSLIRRQRKVLEGGVSLHICVREAQPRRGSRWSSAWRGDNAWGQTQQHGGPSQQLHPISQIITRPLILSFFSGLNIPKRYVHTKSPEAVNTALYGKRVFAEAITLQILRSPGSPG